MKRPLKVAHIVYSLEVGGLEKVATDIISHFDKEKINVSVFCIGKKGEYAKELEKHNIDVSLLNGRKYPLKNAFMLGQILKKGKFDVVHSHSGVDRDAVLGAMLAGVRIIVHTDHGRFYPDSKWSRINHKFFSRFRDKVITVSDELKSFMGNEVGVEQDKLTRIYNGVATNNLDIDVNKKKKELGISPDDKVIGIIARLAPVKDHKTLFLAFKKVREKISNVKLLVIGDGRQKDILMKQADDIGEQKNIIFLGAREDVPELLQIMEVACLSSTHEGHSITLTEAMAAAKPVVATDVGGNPELVIDNVTGILVPPQNPDEMADALLKLLDNEKLRKSMGEAGRKRIKEKFSIENTVKEYEKLYFDLAKGKGIL